jgi:hypothetical protein
MQNRPKFSSAIHQQLTVHPVCALLGPRQCGKTTLALEFGKNYSQQVHHFDLENPEDLAFLSQPMRVLEQLRGLIIIDEVQRLPDLFPLLRVLVDRNQQHPETAATRYLILGSASRDLLRQSSETLAGRIGYIELTPFQLTEIGDATQLLARGGFPRSYLAQNDTDSYVWREAYIQTYLERDIPNLGLSIPPLMLRRFWMMLTHVHGQLLNMSNLGTSLEVSGHTVRRYLDILAGTFMVRLLPPWFENISKRQIKTPKLYFRDSGLLLTLLSIRSMTELYRHPALGAIWEGFALEQVIQSLGLRAEEVFFWRTHTGAELDLFIPRDNQRIGFEFKFTDQPRTTKSMHQAISDLQLEHLYIIYPGQREIALTDKITAVGLELWIKQSHG